MQDHRRRATLAALALACAALVAALISPSTGAEDKLKPEEVVAKHLEAIGAAEARSPSRSRVVAGATRIEVKAGGHGGSEG